MKLKAFFTTLLIIGLASNSFSQLLRSQLLDETTKEAIPAAFIFISNSSIGTSSDENGFFELSIEGLGQVEIVISHLSYDIKSIVLKAGEQLPPRLSLSPKAVGIDEVVVKSKASGKRKQWMRQFENAFLGKSNNRRKVEISNPKVLLFQEIAGGLSAQAMDYIAIANRALGYQLRFYLDTFHVNRSGEVIYAGKVFFREIPGAGDEKRVQKARSRSFRASKTHFFQSLRQEQSGKEPYLLGLAQFNQQGAIDYKPIPWEALDLKRGQKADTLFIENFLAISDRKLAKGEARNPMASPAKRFATSFLRSSSGKIIIDQAGNLINVAEIEELGHWTDYRVADLMPINYNHDALSFADSQPAQTLSNRMIDYLGKVPQEKTYVHLNKPYYTNREAIHFKAYLLDASTHQPTAVSKVLYVDLIHPNGEIVASQQLHKDRGLAGSFTLDQSYPAGQYQIRAYSDYMRNFDSNFFYQRLVSVLDYSIAADSLAVSMEGPLLTSELNTPSSPPLSLSFYPEGGELVQGLLSNVSFKVVDLSGQPLDAKISVIDERKQAVLEEKTIHQGMGLFSLQPQKGSSYIARVHHEGIDYDFPLPKVKATGFVMKVNNAREDRLYIEVAASAQRSLEGAFLVGHTRGQTFCLVEDLDEEAAIILDKSAIPEGLAHLTLFDANSKPVAERLVFIHNLSNSSALRFKQAYSHFRPRQKVELEINTNTKQAAYLSATVTDQSVIRYPQHGQSIKDWLWLNSDLAGYIPNAGYYLEEVDANKRFALDLWVMTYTWRRFKWTDLAEPPALVYPPAQGFSISGYTTQLGKETERIQAEVMLSSLSNDFYVEKITSDKDGNFTFSNLPQLDSTDFILQGQVYNPKRPSKDFKMEGKREVDFHFETPEKPPVQRLLRLTSPVTTELPLDQYLRNEQKAAQLDSTYRDDWVINLDEITVTESRGTDSRIFNAYNLNEMDWIPPERPAMALLTSIKPANWYRHDFSTGELYQLKYGPRGLVRMPLHIFVDGIKVSYDYFFTLIADQIDYISINNSVIYIGMRHNGPRSLQTRLKEGILNFTHPAYHQAREFAAPNYGVPNAFPERADLRTAIHWEPNLQLEENGKTILSFYTADNPSTYEVRVEGVLEDGTPVSERYTFEVRRE